MWVAIGISLKSLLFYKRYKAGPAICTWMSWTDNMGRKTWNNQSGTLTQLNVFPIINLKLPNMMFYWPYIITKKLSSNRVAKKALSLSLIQVKTRMWFDYLFVLPYNYVVILNQAGCFCPQNLLETERASAVTDYQNESELGLLRLLKLFITTWSVE